MTGRKSALQTYCLSVHVVSTVLRSCVKVKVVVLGSLSLMVLMVCVDVKQHCVEVVRRGVGGGGAWLSQMA